MAYAKKKDLPRSHPYCPTPIFLSGLLGRLRDLRQRLSYFYALTCVWYLASSFWIVTPVVTDLLNCRKYYNKNFLLVKHLGVFDNKDGSGGESFAGVRSYGNKGIF